jgi:putative ABC transport system substrate-binding protein
LAGAAGAAVALPGMPRAAQPARVPRIAFLSIPQSPAIMEAIRLGLADHGYVDGQTITFEPFIAPTTPDLPGFALKAVASVPDVILTAGTPATIRARAATNTIPIVFGATNDPVGLGLVASLARPGGNVTGNSMFAPDIASKQLGIAREIMPGLKRIAVLNLPADPAIVVVAQTVREAAGQLSIETVPLDFVEAEDFVRQFAPAVASGAGAFYVPSSVYFRANREALFDLQFQHKVPFFGADVIEPFRGLFGYGPNAAAVYRRSGGFIDAILKGVPPADLPVQQPTEFDFIVSLATAKSFGIAVPPSILAQATIVVG